MHRKIFKITNNVGIEISYLLSLIPIIMFFSLMFYSVFSMDYDKDIKLIGVGILFEYYGRSNFIFWQIGYFVLLLILTLGLVYALYREFKGNIANKK